MIYYYLGVSNVVMSLEIVTEPLIVLQNFAKETMLQVWLDQAPDSLTHVLCLDSVWVCKKDYNQIIQKLRQKKTGECLCNVIICKWILLTNTLRA